MANINFNIADARLPNVAANIAKVKPRPEGLTDEQFLELIAKRYINDLNKAGARISHDESFTPPVEE